MTDTLIASAVVTAITFLGIVIQLYAAHRRWKKQDAAFCARFQAQMEEISALRPPLIAELNLPKWAPFTVSTTLSAETLACVHSPSPALERAIAALNRIVETGETDDDEVAASPLPIDLGGLADRLAEAGYDGGALKLAGVEVHADRHVVVHLEPQRP